MSLCFFRPLNTDIQKKINYNVLKFYSRLSHVLEAERESNSNISIKLSSIFE